MIARRRFLPCAGAALRGREEFDAAFDAFVKPRVDAIAILADATFYVHRVRLGELCLKHRLPAAVGGRAMLDAVGLLSANATDPFTATILQAMRAAAAMNVGLVVTRVRDTGEYPAAFAGWSRMGADAVWVQLSLAIRHAAELSLSHRLAAARVLGLSVPAAMRLRATEVIE